MTTDSPASEPIVLDRIDIVHTLTEEGPRVFVGSQNEESSLVSLLGLLELAKDSLIRERMGEAPDERGD